MKKFRLSTKQNEAVEKITGRFASSFNLEALEVYFAFTDRGKKVEISEEAKVDLDSLLFSHRVHPVIIELWKQDFRDGLLFLSDFLGKDSPPSYIRHSIEIYESVFHFIPSCYSASIENEVIIGKDNNC